MATRTVRLTLPLPAEGLHPNARVHHMAKAKLTAKARLEAGLVAKLEKARQLPHLCRAFAKATVSMLFFMPRRRDEDGLIGWCKAYFDGLQDAGVIVNDSGLTVLPPAQQTGRHAGRKLEMIITEG